MVENSAFDEKLRERVQAAAVQTSYKIVQRTTYELQRVISSLNSLTGTIDGRVETVATSANAMNLYRAGHALSQTDRCEGPEWHPGWDA